MLRGRGFGRGDKGARMKGGKCNDSPRGLSDCSGEGHRK